MFYSRNYSNYDHCRHHDHDHDHHDHHTHMAREEGLAGCWREREWDGKPAEHCREEEGAVNVHGGGLWETPGALPVRDGTSLLFSAPGYRHDGQVSLTSHSPLIKMLSSYHHISSHFKTSHYISNFRPRAMDGSADLKWRYYQSRGGSRRGSPEGRMMSGFSSGYNSKIPYNSWSSPRDIRVPRLDWISGYLAGWLRSSLGISMTAGRTWRAPSSPSAGGWPTSTAG